MSISVPENPEQDHVMVRCCGDTTTVAHAGERLTCAVCGAVFDVRQTAARAFWIKVITLPQGVKKGNPRVTALYYGKKLIWESK